MFTVGGSSFTARYSGTCAECGYRFEVGAQIMYDEDDSLVHALPEECGPARPVRTGAPCPDCFLVHAGECF